MSSSDRHQRIQGQGGGAVPPFAMASSDVFDSFIHEALARYEVPGAAVAIVQDGSVLLTRGYGVRDVNGDELVDADTVFQLASVTKPITAFVLGTLVDEGLIGWDTPVIDVLPELVLQDMYATRFVSLRDLLAHRSGLIFEGALNRLGYDRTELLWRLRFLPPGRSFRGVAQYSNLGYLIAGEVAARLTGTTWEAAVVDRLFRPLGMSRSLPVSNDPPADGNVSAHHGVIDGELQVVPFDDPDVDGAAAAAVSTATDLALWMQMLLDGGEGHGRRLVTEETVTEMFAPAMVAGISFPETPPIDASAGFSWGTYHYHGSQVVEKGGMAGVRSVVCMVPAMKAGIAVVANRNLTFLPEAIRAFALEQWLGAADFDMQADIASRTAFLEDLFAAPPMPVDSVRPSIPLEQFAGTYGHSFYGTAEVVVDGVNLRLELGPAHWPAALRHLSRETSLVDSGTVTSVADPATFVIGPDGFAIGFSCEKLGRFDRISSQ